MSAVQKRSLFVKTGSGQAEGKRGKGSRFRVYSHLNLNLSPPTDVVPQQTGSFVPTAGAPVVARITCRDSEAGEFATQFSDQDRRFAKTCSGRRTQGSAEKGGKQDIYLRLVVSCWIANAFGDVARAVPAAVVILGGVRDKVRHLARLRRGHAVGKALDLGWRRRWGWRRRRW